jgi:hypothetical protein
MTKTIEYQAPQHMSDRVLDYAFDLQAAVDSYAARGGHLTVGAARLIMRAVDLAALYQRDDFAPLLAHHHLEMLLAMAGVLPEMVRALPEAERAPVLHTVVAMVRIAAEDMHEDQDHRWDAPFDTEPCNELPEKQ